MHGPSADAHFRGNHFVARNIWKVFEDELLCLILRHIEQSVFSLQEMGSHRTVLSVAAVIFLVEKESGRFSHLILKKASVNLLSSRSSAEIF